MKKMYVAPEVEELELELEGFLCGSIEDQAPADMGGENNDEDDGL
jgi:hypothetical protein